MATAKDNRKPRSNNKSNANTSTRKRKPKPQQKQNEHSEIYGIIIVACSLIFMFSLYSNKLGYLSIASKKIFVSLFGIAAFIIPVYIIYITIKHYFLKEKISLSRKYWGVTGIILTTMVFLQTINMSEVYVNNNIGESVRKIIESDNYMQGGIISFALVLPIYKFIGTIGLYIIILASYIICSILIFNYNIRGVVGGVHTKSKKLANKTSMNRNKARRQTVRTQSANIEDTFSDNPDNSFKNEIRSRLKILDFMNNSKLEDEEEFELLEILADLDDENEFEEVNNYNQEKETRFNYKPQEEKRSNYNNEQQINSNRNRTKETFFEKALKFDEDIENVKKEEEIKPEPKINIPSPAPKVKSIEKEITVIAEEEINQTQKKNKKLEDNIKEEVDKEISNIISDEKEEEKPSYSYPTAELLNINTHSEMNSEDKKELIRNANKLEETLLSFGVQADILEVTKGPSVTRFEIQPKAGIKVSKIVNLSDDIALGLAAGGIRMEAPIPGKAAIGIEVPNKKQTPVYFREIIESDEFKNSTAPIICALGKDISGKPVVTDISSMPHLLIAGATGSGKSVCINTLIVSLLYKYSPDEVKLLMVDPKVVELSVYNGIPHLLIPVVTEPKKAAGALHWAVKEMDRRYNLFAENGARNIASYNKMADKGIVKDKLPYIVMIVDELADLMMVCPGDVEESICRLAQKARAAGMHLVIATQRPSVDVITGVIKANIPSRISFAVSSQIDSRTILDSAGAEKLLGRGDMLFHPIGKSGNLRVQGAFISEEEVEQVVDHVKDIKQTVENNYEEELVQHMNSAVSDKIDSGDDDRDELLDEATRIVVETGQASASFIQRRLRIGFNRAARIIEQLEDIGVISPRDGSKPRQVLITKEELENI